MRPWTQKKGYSHLPRASIKRSACCWLTSSLNLIAPLQLVLAIISSMTLGRVDLDLASRMARPVCYSDRTVSKTSGEETKYSWPPCLRKVNPQQSSRPGSISAGTFLRVFRCVKTWRGRLRVFSMTLGWTSLNLEGWVSP